MTIDRNVGIEFFDHGGKRNRPGYLIDYTPTAAIENGHRLLITSRYLSELEAVLRPVLKQHHLDVGGDHAHRLLKDLRSLSGHLALKLISSPTQQMEALGLALARIYLAYQGAMANQIILPLDTHLDLFRIAKTQAEAIEEATNLQRTDLALFSLNADERTVICNLVEVKCYSGVGGLGAYSQLKAKVADQLEQSETALRRHFDPLWKDPDRPDRLIKTRELVNLLRFYLARSQRYGLLDAQATREGEFLLATLEQGYFLRFTQSSLVFDFATPGTEAADFENGIEYHRIGFDLIQDLLAAEDPSTVSSSGSEPEPRKPRVPRLESAAFLVPQKSRDSDLQAEHEVNGTAKPVVDPRSERTPSEAVPAETSKPAVAEPGTVNTTPHPEMPLPITSPGVEDRITLGQEGGQETSTEVKTIHQTDADILYDAAGDPTLAKPD